MPWLAIKLFMGGALKRLLNGLSALFNIARSHPWQFALALALCLSGWLWRGKQSAIAERDAARAETAQAINAGQQALAAQIKLHDETKAAYAAAAKDADNAHEIELAAASDRTERYISSHGVRQACGSRASVASAPAEDRSAGLHEEVPADSVVVSAADVRTCTAATSYAVSAWKWGQSLKADGLAQ